jgi:cytosine/adenosine deaminase-related metal-dependent hydrolase
MLRADSLAMTPMSNPVGALVFQAGRGDIDTVVVNGKDPQVRRGSARRIGRTRAPVG